MGLREERDCESKSASRGSHASMSAHINIYFITKTIRENYKRFPKEPHAGRGRLLSHQANVIWQKGRALESGHVWALLFADHRAQQRSPSAAHLHSDLHGVMGDEAVGGLSSINNLQPFLQF